MSISGCWTRRLARERERLGRLFARFWRGYFVLWLSCCVSRARAGRW